MALRIERPTSFLVSGASGSGKSRFIFRLIEHRDKIFSEKIDKILYFYAVYQDLFSHYTHCVEFIQGVPTEDLLCTRERKLVVIDDLMSEKEKIFTKIFTVFSHHYKFHVIFTVQNLFNRQIREISLNSKFVVLFKNCRDLNQIQCFLRQAFPQNFRAVMQAYLKETQKPYTYICLDFRPDTEQKFRIRSQIFPDETNYILQ